MFGSGEEEGNSPNLSISLAPWNRKSFSHLGLWNHTVLLDLFLRSSMKKVVTRSHCVLHSSRAQGGNEHTYFVLLWHSSDLSKFVNNKKHLFNCLISPCTHALLIPVDYAIFGRHTLVDFLFLFFSSSVLLLLFFV